MEDSDNQSANYDWHKEITLYSLALKVLAQTLDSYYPADFDMDSVDDIP